MSIWDPKNRELLRTIAAHRAAVVRLAFSPDGRRLATASLDSAARVWDGSTGQRLLTLEGHTGSVVDVDFSPDGKRLLTASFDDTVNVWVLPPDDLIALARSRLTRTFTPEECRQYLHVEACSADVPRPAGSER